MKVDAFKDLLEAGLRKQGIDVQRYQVQEGMEDLAVQGDIEYRLRIVRTSGEPGDPERHRPEGDEIEVVRR